MMDIYAYLIDRDIKFECAEHIAVSTCEEAEEHVPPLPGAHTKNLFLRDGQGRRHFLVVVEWQKQVDLKTLSSLLNVGKLGMASPERLAQHLGVEPGAVTLLALVNDGAGRVEVVVDRFLWEADALQCHPLVNTATLAIAHSGIEAFLQYTDHVPKILEVPSR